MAAAERRAADLTLVLDADIEAQSRTAGSEQVLRVIARRLADLCRVPLVDISSIERDRLRTVVSWDRDGFNHAVEGIEYPLASWPVTRAALAERASGERSTTVWTHASTPPRSPRWRPGEWPRSLVLPLVANGVVIGVAEVYDSEPRDFADVVDAARVLAEVAGHILDKALLVEALEARSHTMHELIELGALVGRAQDPVTLAEYVAERLLTVTGAVCCEISKSEREGVRVLVSLDSRPDRQDPEATKNIDSPRLPGGV